MSAVSLTDTVWNRTAALVVARLKVPVSVFMRNEAAALFDLLQRRTPPKTKAQGAQAVSRDLRRAIEPTTAKDWESPRLKQIVQQKDEAALQAVLDIARPGWRVVSLDPRAHHKSKRDRRGRIRRPQRFMTLDVAEWKKHEKATRRKVGWWRRGWAPVIRAMGGTLPAWVARHSGAPGTVINNLAATNPSVTGINQARGIAGNSGLDRLIPWALRTRSKAMLARMRHLIREQKTKAGL